MRPVLRPMGLSTCQWFYFDCNFPAYGYQFRAKCNVNSPAQAWQFTQGTPSEIRLSKTNFCFDPSLRQYIPYEHFGVNFWPILSLGLKVCSGGADQKFLFSNEGIITLNKNSSSLSFSSSSISWYADFCHQPHIRWMSRGKRCRQFEDRSMPQGSEWFLDRLKLYIVCTHPASGNLNCRIPFYIFSYPNCLLKNTVRMLQYHVYKKPVMLCYVIFSFLFI